MRTTRMLLSGESARLTVPDATALPAPTTTAVILDRSREFEFNAGGQPARDFFLSATGSRLTGSVEVRDKTLRYGPLGGRASSGRVFTVGLGGQHIFGSCGARIALADLAGIVSRMRLAGHPNGASMTLGKGLTWSSRLPVSLAQVVDLTGEHGFLLDVRRARGAMSPRGDAGIAVEGGRLSRSGAGDRTPHLILESAAFVTYGVPRPGTSLDEVADAMTRVRVDLV